MLKENLHGNETNVYNIAILERENNQITARMLAFMVFVLLPLHSDEAAWWHLLPECCTENSYSVALDLKSSFYY